jgi:receptor protein-tyrosine kinase
MPEQQMKDIGTLHQVAPPQAATPSQTVSTSRTIAQLRRSLTIGEILVAGQKMTPEQVEKVLQAQKSSDLRFGEIALKFGFVRREDVDHALAIQFGYSTGEPNVAVPAQLTAAVMPTAPFAEALRGLRSQLMMRWFDGTPGQVALAITSVDRGDGKSFVTANLGVVFSQLGERTLIVDADLRHSTQHKLFGARNRMGLSGILSGRADFEEISQIEHFPKLSVLPAGPLPPNPLELLGRDEFALLLNELSSQFDVILIDTPSAQQAADAQVLAQRARGVLIVGRKDHTKSSELAQLASIFSSSGATVLGTTLNEY